MFQSRKGPYPLLALLWLVGHGLFAVETPVTFQVDMSVQAALGSFNPSAGDLVRVAGDPLNGWSASASVLTNSAQNTNLYRGTFVITNTAGTPVSYKFLMSGIWEKNNVGPGGVQNRQFSLASTSQVLPVVFFDNLTNAGSLQSTQEPFKGNLAGADMSMLAHYESRGTNYRDGGSVDDALLILKRRGFNCVRLRLFTSSAAQAQADPYNYVNTLEYTVPLALRVKQAGLAFLLDFHYSDTWADPGKQAVPAAWTNLSFPQLVQRVRDYSSNCIAAFRAAGAMPDFVQLGNEITPGFLWPHGRVGGSYDTALQWSQFVQLLTSARMGVQDAAAGQMPRIIIHIDRGGDWAGTMWFFDNLILRQFPFDIIGESYYPTWHGPVTNLATCLAKTARRYNKAMLVAETAFPYSSNSPTNIFGFPATTNGQVQYVVALAKVLKGVSRGQVTGACWWWTEYPRSDKSLFDLNMNILPAAAAFGQIAAPVRLNLNRSGTNLLIHWPLSGAGMSLETAAAPNLGWEPASIATEAPGTETGFQYEIGAYSNGYYRLRGE